MAKHADAFAVTGNMTVTGALDVQGDLTGSVTGSATSVGGLTFADAPVEVDSESVTLAEDLYVALVALGLIEDVA